MNNRIKRGAVSVETGVLIAIVSTSVIVGVTSLASATRSALERTVQLTSTSQPHAAIAKEMPEEVEPQIPSTQAMGWIAPICCAALLAVPLVKRRRRTIAAHQVAEEARRISTIAEVHFASLFQKRQEIYRILSKDELALYEGRMQVRQLMTRQVHTVQADTSITEVRKKLREHEMRHLLVCSAAGDLLGVISDRDLKGGVAKAGDLMTRSVFTVEPDTLVNPAITSLLDNQVSSLPVVEDGKLVGIITTTDFLMALQCTLQLITKSAAERPKSADACQTS